MSSGRYSRKRYMLMEEARKYAVPMKHTEFTCPCCGGIASVAVEDGLIKAECHVTGIKVYEVKR